jgi:hypothetical protein
MEDVMVERPQEEWRRFEWIDYLLGTTASDFSRPHLPNYSRISEVPEYDLLINLLRQPAGRWDEVEPGVVRCGLDYPHEVEIVEQGLAWNRWVGVEPEYPGGFSYVSPRGVDGRAVMASSNPTLYDDRRSTPWKRYLPLLGIEMTIVEVSDDWTEQSQLAFRPLYLDAIANIGVTYFASGANSYGDMRGFLNTGHNVGAAVQEFVKGWNDPQRVTTSEGIVALATDPDYADRLLFLDSGAFSSVNKQLEEVDPISDQEWKHRLGIYIDAAEILGERLYAVLPDRPGDQYLTLTRMAAYADKIHELRDLGAVLLTPIPRLQVESAGDPIPMSDQFYWSASDLEGVGIPMGELVPAIPTAIAPVSPTEAAQFLSDVERDHGVVIRHVHLLGSGPTTPTGMAKIEHYVEALRAVNPDLEISCDSAEKRRLSNREPVYKERYLQAQSFFDFASTHGVLPWNYFGDESILDSWLHRPLRKKVWEFLTGKKEIRQVQPPRFSGLGLKLTAAEKAAYLDGPYPTAWLFNFGREHPDQEADIVTFLWDMWAERTGIGSRFATDWIHQKALEFTMAALREKHLHESSRRVLVITSCTGRKDGPAPAEQLYTGDQHVALMAGVEAARDRGFDVDVWIVSAGLGVVHGSTVCDSYNITFSGESQATIRRRARALNIPADVAELLAGEYDLALVLLGRDYLIASELGNVSEFGGGPVMVAVAPSALRLLPDDPHIFPELIDKARAKRLRGQIRAKGEWAQEFLHDLEPW